MTFFKTLH